MHPSSASTPSSRKKVLLLTGMAGIAVLCALVWAWTAYRGSTVNRLLGLIRADLPAGWTVSYEKQYAWLEVSRAEPVLSTSAVPNSSPFEPAEMRNYSFAFRIMTQLPPDKYRQRQSENEKTQKVISALYEELRKRRVDRKFDSFRARNESDKPLVAQYDALKKSLHELPDFYFADISLMKDWHDYVSPVDERVDAECQRVREQVEKLLSKYEK